MHCPVDNEPQQMTERQGVEIDYCPRCRGVWLDRGELDKIIERSGDLDDDDDDRRPRPEPRYPDPRHQEPRYQEPRYQERHHDDDDDRYRGYGQKRKKKSFLSEMFDF